MPYALVRDLAVIKLKPPTQVHSRVVYIPNQIPEQQSDPRSEPYSAKLKQRRGRMAQSARGALLEPQAAGGAARAVALTVLSIVAWWVSALLGGVSASADYAADGTVKTSRLFNW